MCRVNTNKLRRSVAAEYIQREHGVPCSVGWLAKLAVTGGGPPFVKVGKFPIYAVQDLDEWVASRTSPLMYSTSDIRR